MLTLPFGVDDARAQDPQADSTEAISVVRGYVLDHDTADPIVGATVLLGTGPPGSATIGSMETDEAGAFRFNGVASGTYWLSVTSLSYSARQDTLFVEPDVVVDVILELSPTPIVLEPVVVTTRMHLTRTRDGFEYRRTNANSSSSFYTREDFAKRPIRNVTDLFAMAPGTRLTPIGPLGNYVTVNGCRPAVWVDGYRYLEFELQPGAGGDPLGVDWMVTPDEVESVELYTRRQDVPRQFGPACGAVVIWRRLDNRGRWKPWQRFLMAVGIFGTAVWIAK